MNISQSQINLYRFCPHAYKLCYKDGCEGILFDPDVFEVGRRVHDASDKYYKNYYESNISERGILQKSYGILRSDWDTMLSAKLLAKAYQNLQGFAKFEIQNIKDGLITKPLSEVKISVDGLTGKIDYLHLVKPKAVDLKTSGYPNIGYDSKMQAVMYKILIKKRFNIELDEFFFEFLYPGITKSVSFAEKGLEEIEIDLYNIEGRIIESWNTGEFPKKPKTEKSCNSCEYRFYCKE